MLQTHFTFYFSQCIFHYINNIILLNNPKFNNYTCIDLIYTTELEIKDITDSRKWANYINFRLKYDEADRLYKRLFAIF